MGVNKKEIIESLERACDLFDKIQERKAVIKAEEIVKETSIGRGGMKHRCTNCGQPLNRIEADFCSIECKLKYNELIHRK